ncbi:MAG: DUF2116 family Zn-ribbon domain-containing protein, partial [Candidatus Levybacteria bacterium]|nr:DUF2116 family Zn-ribbon domain-containing protein [Candidatus Levybacteria bacterium]
MKKRAKRGDIGEHKFCPVCGRKLELNDTYCTKCGYSFASRGKKPKKLKWKNIIIFIILLIAAYFGVR